MTKEITLPEITLPKWMTEPVTLPKWMTDFTLPEWMTTKIALPTWGEMKAMIPWWLGGTKGKKEDLTGAADAPPVQEQKMKWPEMPALPQIQLNLPKWMTDKDYFKFKWPEITIEDLTEGVKNIIRAMLPDPIKDPWMYKLIPQKIYDWLGVPTAVREAQAELANASAEIQQAEAEIKFEQDRIRRSEGGENVYSVSAENPFGREGEGRSESLETIDELTTEIKKQTIKRDKADTALQSLSDTVSNSRAHLVTDIGLLLTANKGVLPVKIFKEDMVMPRVSNFGQLLKMAAMQSAGGGGTTINNVTVAPSSSNSISSIQKTENTYGTVDPYTSAAGAYG